MLRTILTLVSVSVIAFADRPVFDRLDTGDTSNPMLYQSVQTSADDPTLGPNQRRVTVHSRPVWYLGRNGNPLPIDTALAETVDLETGESAVGNATNTLAFKVGADGSALYIRDGHQLRVSLMGTTSEMDKDDISPYIEPAERPDLTEFNGARAILGGVLSGVTVEHVVEPGRVKESLIISRGPVAASVVNVRYTWRYETDLTPVQERGEIEWRDGDETVFTFDHPVAFAADGEIIPCMYDLEDGVVSIVFNAKALRSVAFPVTLDPSVSTDASTECYNRTIGNSGVPGWNATFAEMALPDLTGFASIDTATFTVTAQAGGGFPGVIADAYCDAVSAWDETDSAGTLDALSFNAATENNVTVDTGSVTEFDILGASGTNGIAKIYADDASPTYGTVKLTWDGSSGSNDSVETSLRLGFLSGLGNERVLWYPHTDATYFWYATIVYTAGATTNVQKGSGTVGIIGP